MLKKKILLASYGGGHINMLIPVYKALTKSEYEPIIFGFTAAEINLKKQKIEFISYKNFLSDYSDQNQIREYGEELHRKLGSGAMIDKDESIAYLGINYFELVQRYGEEQAREKYEKDGRKAFFPLNFMNYVITKINPIAVISTNSPRSEEAILKAANQQNIPSYCINDFFSKMELKERTGFPSYARRIFVANEKIKHFFVSAGWNEKHIIPSGNPAFDSINNELTKHESEVLDKKYHLNKKRNILFIMANGEQLQKIDDEIFDCLIKLRAKHDCNLILRPHPNNTKELPQADYILSKKEENIHSWIHVSDIIVTIISTVALEASILNKKIIQYLPDNATNKISFSELGIGIETKEISEFQSELENLLTDKSEYDEDIEYSKPAAEIISNYIIDDLKSFQEHN